MAIALAGKDVNGQGHVVTRDSRAPFLNVGTETSVDLEMPTYG